MAKKKAKKRPAAKAKARSAKPAKKVSKKPAKKAVKKAVKKTAARATPAPKPAVPKWLAAGYQYVNPYLNVRNVEAAIQFYEASFGFSLKFKMAGPDGKTTHAELLHNSSTVMLGPENQERGAFAPAGPQGINLYIYVEKVDDVCAMAANNGGKVNQPPTDMAWGDRVGVVVDPDGHTWWIATHVKDVSMGEMNQSSQ